MCFHRAYGRSKRLFVNRALCVLAWRVAGPYALMSIFRWQKMSLRSNLEFPCGKCLIWGPYIAPLFPSFSFPLLFCGDISEEKARRVSKDIEQSKKGKGKVFLLLLVTSFAFSSFFFFLIGSYNGEKSEMRPAVKRGREKYFRRPAK